MVNPSNCKNNSYSGIDAVIDKDKSSALMAKLVDANILLILTAVPKVYLNYGKEDESFRCNNNI